MVCRCRLPGLSTGLLISAVTVLLISFLYGLYEALGLVYLFAFDLLSWFSLVTGLISVVSAALALIGRNHEDIPSLQWAFIWGSTALGCATVMTAFLLIFQTEAASSRETRILTIVRIFSMYFFNVLLPLSWLCYEVREFTVVLLHETNSQADFRRRRYDSDMNKEVNEVLPTSRKTWTTARGTRDDGDGLSESETISMIRERELGRKRRRR